MRTYVALVCSLVAVSAAAATVESVSVRQLWPWSAETEIRFSVSGLEQPVKVVAEAFDGETALDSERLNKEMSGDRYVVAAKDEYVLRFDPRKAFPDRKAISGFSVKLTLSEEPLPYKYDEEVYRIVDLATGAITSVRRLDFYNGLYGRFDEVVCTNYFDFADVRVCELNDVFIWTDVTNHDEYATCKMVFRRVPATGKTFTMQAESAANAHQVSFGKDFFIGIYEITGGQYARLNSETGNLDDCVPKNTSWQNLILGNYGSWPTNSATRTAYGKTALKLQNLCGKSITFPTEAEWEFACRAGYTGSSCYTGGAYSDCEWHSKNASNTQHPVGLKTPNAFGLYDMLGNIGEFVMDWWQAPMDTTAVTDPPGPGHEEATPVDGSYRRTIRGGKRSNTEIGVNARQASASSSSNVSQTGGRYWMSAD